MSKLTYLFYDIETTGLNPCFDQVLQFAAIRTDLELNELERHEFIIKLNPDCIPSPYATITHRIGIKEVATGQTELAAIRQIHALLNTPNTISLGYNTLGFDDEFLRFSFYRNLLPAYTHQYAQNCSRMDLYPIAILYYLYCPTVIQWPLINDKISLKLENLSRLNKLAEGQAHNAMVDVIATVELAKKFKQETKMWDYVCGYFNKQLDAERMSQLTPAFQHIDARVKEALLIQGNLGSAHYFQAPVLALGPHQVYKNQSLWLRLDYLRLSELPRDTFAEKAYVFRKRIAEPPILLPSIERFLKYLSPERLTLVNNNKEFLAQNPALLQSLCDYHQNYIYPNLENVDVDAALYQRDFPTKTEEQLNVQFHSGQEAEQKNLLSLFRNPQQSEQALRILGRHHSELLTEAQREEFSDYLARCRDPQNEIIDYKGGLRLNIEKALGEIKELYASNTLDEQQKNLLLELEIYYRQKESLCCS